MHKGIKPSAQPRSIRTIAESNDSANFPATAPSDNGSRDYADAADAIKPKKADIRGLTSADKSPFTNIRGK